MQQAARDAADALRNSLARDEPASATFREALAAVPASDRDAWLDLLLEIDALPDDDPDLPRGCVPYLPSAVATVVQAVQQAAVTHADVFVDVGSGVGRAVALAHLLTGAECIGLEIQPALVHAARLRVARLQLNRVCFVEGDAADLVSTHTTGTVFFLYCPFGGARLERVLDGLEAIARARQIRVCCVDMAAVDRWWLAAAPPTSVDLAVYWSTAHAPQAR